MAKLKRPGGDPVVVSKGPEFTKVDDETERKIPLRTWVSCVVVSAVDVLSFVGVLVLASRQIWNWMHPPRIYGSGWWPSVVRSLTMWVPTIGIAVLGGVIAWSVPLLYRFLVETLTKHPPQYTPYPSEWGMWRPWRKPVPDDGDEYEEEAPSTAESVPYKVDGEMATGDRSRLYLQFELEDYSAALKWHKFCKAVHKRGRNFSYNEAVRRHRLSAEDWKRIYNAFTSQQWAVPAGRRGTPELRAVGKHWVKMYAMNPPPPPA